MTNRHCGPHCQPTTPVLFRADFPTVMSRKCWAMPIQALLDQIDEADEPKDIADLQARIQGEQMMLQNEQVKLAALSQMQQSRRDGYEQRKKDLARYPTHGHKSYSPAITAARAAVVAGTAAAYAVFSAAIGAE